MDWLKELITSLLNDLEILRVYPQFRSIVATMLTAFREVEKKHNFIGSTRTEIKMLVTLVTHSFQ